MQIELTHLPTRPAAPATYWRNLAGAILLHLLLLLLWLRLPPPMQAASPVPAAGRTITAIMLSAPARPSSKPATPAEAPQAEPAAALRSESESREQARSRPQPAESRQRPERSAIKQAAPPEPAELSETDSPPPRSSAATESSVPASTPPSATDSRAGVSSGSQPPSALMVQEFPLSYLTQLSRIVNRNVNYPSWSMRNAEQGVAIVRLRLARNGRVIEALVVRSSGYDSLDAEAREVMMRIGRFPPIPSAIYPGQLAFLIDQPVRFRMQ